MINIFASIVVGLFFVNYGFATTPASFSDVINNPAEYNGKTVSIRGLAHVLPDRFYLYQSVVAASNVDTRKAVYVADTARSHVRFNNRWVRITGTVDAHQHGPFGFGFPCEIRLHDIEPL